MSTMLLIIFLFFSFFFLGAPSASAHEAYVLPHDFFWQGIMRAASWTHTFDAFTDPHNIFLTIIIGGAIASLILINFFFRRSRFGNRAHSRFERLARYGSHSVRIAVAVVLFFSAQSNTFLGPELYGSSFSHPLLVKILLYVLSGMIVLGLLTELAAVVAIMLYCYSVYVFGSYMFAYANYLGEFLVLLLFGMRVFSVDTYIFGPLKKFQAFQKYESVIVRVMYGAGLIFAAVTVKLMHPELTIAVVNTWHLTQFHFLFPGDPRLVTFGAGIVELVVGLFIIFGFESNNFSRNRE